MERGSRLPGLSNESRTTRLRGSGSTGWRFDSTDGRRAAGGRGDGVVDEDGGDGGGGGEGLGVEDPAAGRGAIQQQRQLFAELFGVGGAGLAGGIGEPGGKGLLVVAGVERVPGGPGRGFRRPPR